MDNTEEQNKALELHDVITEVANQVQSDFGFNRSSEVQNGIGIPPSPAVELHANHHDVGGFDPTVLLTVGAVKVGSDIFDWVKSSPRDQVPDQNLEESLKTIDREAVDGSGMRVDVREHLLERQADQLSTAVALGEVTQSEAEHQMGRVDQALTSGDDRQTQALLNDAVNQSIEQPQRQLSPEQAANRDDSKAALLATVGIEMDRDRGHDREI